MHVTYFILPIFLAVILIIGIKKNSYESFIEGAKKGINIALETFPYLLAMILVTKLLNGSMILIYLFKKVDIPNLLLLEGIFRPLSSSSSLSVLIDIFNQYGVDSKLGITASVLQGATDTSLYVITVYYGAIGVKKYPYSLFMAFISDILIFTFSLVLFYIIL